jgi:uncharacterized protein YdeI (YjbR/CyaY-like superfamily)
MNIESVTNTFKRNSSPRTNISLSKALREICLTKLADGSLLLGKIYVTDNKDRQVLLCHIWISHICTGTQLLTYDEPLCLFRMLFEKLV